MNNIVYQKLKELAKNQKKIIYTDLNKECGLFLDFSQSKDRKELGEILGEIAKFEIDHERPMITALVLLKNKTEPAYGFYKYADELGIRKPGEENRQLLFRQITESHAYWKDKKV